VGVMNPRTYRTAYKFGEARRSLAGNESRALVDGINNLRGTLTHVAALEQKVQQCVLDGDADAIADARGDLFEYITTRIPVLLAETSP
jgi:hypothetical protein